MIRIPAVSSPWMAPTTRTFRWAFAALLVKRTIGRPWSEWPITLRLAAAEAGKPPNEQQASVKAAMPQIRLQAATKTAL